MISVSETLSKRQMNERPCHEPTLPHCLVLEKFPRLPGSPAIDFSPAFTPAERELA